MKSILESLEVLKTAVFAVLEALNSVNLVNFSLKKCKNSCKSKFRASKCVQIADFALVESPKMVSRKKSE